MLVEPDMQARYLAATLDVITAKLDALDMPAGERTAILSLASSAAGEAHQLADALALPPHAPATSTTPRRLSAPTSNNVLPFQRRA